MTENYIYIALANKLGITDSAVLVREEERNSKKKAFEMFDIENNRVKKDGSLKWLKRKLKKR